MDSIFGTSNPKFKTDDDVEVELSKAIITKDQQDDKSFYNESIVTRHREWYSRTLHYVYEAIINIHNYSNPQQEYENLKSYDGEEVVLYRRSDGNAFKDSDDNEAKFKVSMTEIYISGNKNYPDQLVIKFESVNGIDVLEANEPPEPPAQEVIWFKNDITKNSPAGKITWEDEITDAYFQGTDSSDFVVATLNTKNVLTMSDDNVNILSLEGLDKGIIETSFTIGVILKIDIAGRGNFDVCHNIHWNNPVPSGDYFFIGSFMSDGAGFNGGELRLSAAVHHSSGTYTFLKTQEKVAGNGWNIFFISYDNTHDKITIYEPNDIVNSFTGTADPIDPDVDTYFEYFLRTNRIGTQAWNGGLGEFFIINKLLTKTEVDVYAAAWEMEYNIKWKNNIFYGIPYWLNETNRLSASLWGEYTNGAGSTTGTLNGIQTVVFDGSNDFYVGSSTLDILNGKESITYIIVLKGSGTSDVVECRYASGSPNTWSQLTMVQLSANSKFNVFIRDDQNHTINLESETVSNWTIVAWTWDAVNKEVKIYINGNTYTASNASMDIDNNPNFEPYFGCQFAGNFGSRINFFAGEVAQRIIHQEKKSTSYINDICNALADKLALSWTDI